jgi:hypothetical protein
MCIIFADTALENGKRACVERLECACVNFVGGRCVTTTLQCSTLFAVGCGVQLRLWLATCWLCSGLLTFCNTSDLDLWNSLVLHNETCELGQQQP